MTKEYKLTQVLQLIIRECTAKHLECIKASISGLLFLKVSSYFYLLGRLRKLSVIKVSTWIALDQMLSLVCANKQSILQTPVCATDDK